MTGAPRPPDRPWRRLARGALLPVALWLAAPAPAAAQITAAEYQGPTTRYDHGVLGDAVEWDSLSLTLADGRRVLMQLPQNRVFEDTAPRLADLDGDGKSEVVTVETDLAWGARLAIWDETGLKAATPFIGQPHRWLAPAGIADLDGDGRAEIAYVDRPHLAKVLRLWRYEAGRLSEIASAPGFSNHRIGWPFIAGGVRHCGAQPELILADGAWTRVLAVKLADRRIFAQDLGPYGGPEDLGRALICPD